MNMRSGVTERAEGFACQEDAADGSAVTGGVAGEELLSCVCSAWSAQGEEIEQEVADDIHGHGGCGRRSSRSAGTGPWRRGDEAWDDAEARGLRGSGADVMIFPSLRVAAQEEDEEERVEMGIEREEREEGIGPRWLGRLGLEELDGPAGPSRPA